MINLGRWGELILSGYDWPEEITKSTSALSTTLARLLLAIRCFPIQIFAAHFLIERLIQWLSISIHDFPRI